MKDNLEINKQKLGIDNWLKLIEEDKNLNGANISVAQYIWLLERQIKKQKEVIEKAIEFSNKNWGTWCTHHLEYMTELQNILKEVSE